MVIKRSSSAEVARLLGALLAADPVGRETAAARLAILGRRAVDRLAAALPVATVPEASIAILDVLERIGDARGAAAATPWLRDARPEVALAAVAVVRRTLGDDAPDAAALAAESLAAIASDPAVLPAVRGAALEALKDLPQEVVEPLVGKPPDDRPGAAGAGPIGTPRNGAVEVDAEPGAKRSTEGPRRRQTRRAGAGGVAPGDAAPNPPEGPTTRAGLGRESVEAPADSASWLAAWVADETAPPSAEPVRRAVAAAGSHVPLSLLHHLVTKVRALEGRAGAEDAEAWRALRGAVHQALAERGSRVALYDLRETLEAAPATLPVSMVAALAAIGDASCLEGIGAAWARTADRWLKDQLRDAFAGIVARESLTRRHASVRRVAAHHPELLDAVSAISTPSRTTPSRSRASRT